VKFGLVAVFAVLLIAGAVYSVSDDATPVVDAGTVDEGAALYAEHCASCHGADLSGEPNWQQRDADGYLPAPPHDETGHTWHHPTEQLFAIVKHGTEEVVGGGYKSRMAGYGEILSDDQIHAVLAYIKSTWPRQVVAHHDSVDAAQANR
jgi:mono/diheme cytochrome c family protein